jgi:aurora kinase
MLYNLHSTKSKPSSQDKGSYSAKFFKKLSTDENEKNLLNYADRQLKMPQSTRNIISLTAHQDDHKTAKQEAFTKPFSRKKPQSNFINLSKPQSKINPSPHTHEPHSSQKDSAKTLRKESSVRNLKLTTSTSAEFPYILAKSVSQTTLNRKMDDHKIKLLEKIGARKKQTTPDKPLSINQFRLGKKLGSGRFGNVYLAEEKSTRTIWALKVMNKQKIRDADMVDQVFWEIKLQIYMNHPNILKLYGFFDDAKNIYLIL